MELLKKNLLSVIPNFNNLNDSRSIFYGVFCIFSLSILKKYTNGGVNKYKSNQTEKVVIITGGNTGIGFETAKELAILNATVILACRDQQRGEEAVEKIKKQTKNSNIYFLRLDLSDYQSIRVFIDQFKKQFSKLDILINNAGVMALPQRKETKNYLEMQFGTNHIGHFTLTYLLLDYLKQSKEGRIINVSSKAHERGLVNFDDINSLESYSPFAAYSQSKLCNIYFTYELQKRLKQQKIENVKVVSLHPGVVRTELSKYALEPLHIKIPLYVMTPVLYPLFFLLTKSPWYGAQTSLHCALVDFDKLEGGQYYSDCKVKKPTFRSKNWEKECKELWDYSYAFV